MVRTARAAAACETQRQQRSPSHLPARGLHRLAWPGVDAGFCILVQTFSCIPLLRPSAPTGEAEESGG